MAAKISNSKSIAAKLEHDGYSDADSLLCLPVDALMEEYKLNKQDAGSILKQVGIVALAPLVSSLCHLLFRLVCCKAG